jgi:TonB-dependent receptor
LNTLQAQEDAGRITIRLQQVSLRQAFTAIEAKGGTRIAFNSRLAELDKMVDTSFTDAAIEEVLRTLLKGTSLLLKKAQHYYFISSKNGIPGGLSGRIVDIETSDPLANASVFIKALGKGTMADEQGYYYFDSLPPGKYVLELSFAGYRKFTAPGVEIKNNIANQYDGLLQAENQLQRVSVKTSGRFGRVSNTTDAQLVNEIRTSRSVISGISNEQIQKSTDRDAGEIAKRITGVNVVDNFAIIRGLNRRYNITFLNDLIAPATEQDSRAFALDLVNSSLIDKMIVYKSPAPDLPGDFVGGTLKIITKNTMLVKQLDVQLSASYRPHSSFSDFYTYKGGKNDWLGFDDGTRKLPAGFPDILKLSLSSVKEKAAYGKMLSNNWQYVSANQDIDKRMVINYYDSWKLGKYSWLSNLTSVTYTSTVTTNEIERQFGPSRSSMMNINGKQYERKFALRTISSDVQSQNSNRLGILQNLSLTLKDSSRIDFRNFFNQLGNDLVNISVLTDEERLDEEQKSVRLYYRQRRIYTGQLGGTHYLFAKRKNPLRWSLGYANTNQQEPDMRTLSYLRYWQPGVAPLGENPAAPWDLVLSEGKQYYPFNRRLFSNTTENGYTASADYEHKLLHNGLVIKAGTYHEFKEREFSAREFEVVTGEGYFDQRISSIGNSNINDLYHPDNYRDNGSGFELQEFAGTRYTASNQWNAGYVALVAPLFRQKLNVYAGTRYDYYHFRMAATGRSGISVVYPIAVDNPDHFILPSVNITWNARPGQVVRAAFARSINRPEFREVAPFAYFNNTTQILEYGNPGLKTATFSNYDLRWEWYPQSNKQNEMVSLGLFYKKGKDLIEAFTVNDYNSQSGNQLLFKNSKEADFYGVELDIRKNLDFFSSRFLRRFSVILNGSWIKTEVLTPGDAITLGMGNSNRQDRKRPLQGQSPWLVNAILNYDNVRWGSRISLSYNYAADRISVVGNNDLAGDGITGPNGNDQESGFPDIMEKGRGVLDFSILQRVSKWLQIKCSVQDLLNNPVLFYEDRNRNYKYNAEVMESSTGGGTYKTSKGDNIFLRYKPFSYYTLSFNFSFY